jgi:hypothetical protein
LFIDRIICRSTYIEEATKTTLCCVTHVADFYRHFAYGWFRMIEGIAPAEYS